MVFCAAVFSALRCTFFACCQQSHYALYNTHTNDSKNKQDIEHASGAMCTSALLLMV